MEVRGSASFCTLTYPKVLVGTELIDVHYSSEHTTLHVSFRELKTGSRK